MSERDEYTPDTWAVRAAYTRAMRQAFIASTSEHIEEFDRWLAAHDRTLREQIARGIEVMLIGQDAGRGSEVIAAHDSALSRAARIARGKAE